MATIKCTDTKVTCYEKSGSGFSVPLKFFNLLLTPPQRKKKTTKKSNINVNIYNLAQRFNRRRLLS